MSDRTGRSDCKKGPPMRAQLIRTYARVIVTVAGLFAFWMTGFAGKGWP
jgi:hypothetical protein